MSEIPAADLRRTPQQSRAKQTVEVILEATAQLLRENDLGKLSTNRIAKRAGVSVGSLYQYFSNKEAVIEEMVVRLCEEDFALIMSKLGELQQAPLEETIEQLLDALLSHHLNRPGLMALIYRLAAEYDKDGAIYARWTDALISQVADALRERPDLELIDPQMTAHVIVTAVDGVLHRTELGFPERLEDPQLRDELCLMLKGYLRAFKKDRG